MAVNEQIVTGRKFRKLLDEATKLWQRISFWTKATDVEFDDGQTAESKMGAIKGITTDLNVTETGYAADATMLTQLYSDITIKTKDIEKIISYLWPDILPLFQNGKIYAGYTFSSHKFSGTTINTGVVGNVIMVGVQGGDGSYSTKVDLTKFTNIRVIGRSQAIIRNEYAASFKVSRNADLSNWLKGVEFTDTDAEYSISVSDLSGEYYIGLYTHSSTDYNSCIVKRILLE